MPPPADNITPLHLAACGGHREMVDLLLAASADRNDRDISHDATPGEWARMWGHPDIAGYLESLGRKPAIWSPPPQDYFCPAFVFRAGCVGIRSAAHAWHLRTNVEAVEPPHEIETGLSEALPDFRVGPADVPQRLAHVPPRRPAGTSHSKSSRARRPSASRLPCCTSLNLESSTKTSARNRRATIARC